MKKKHIAIITTGYKPVPAVRGGAVQVLNTYLLEQNEKRYLLDIDLYTIYDNKIKTDAYKNTKIIMIKENKVITFLYKIVNKINSKIFNLNFIMLNYPSKVKKILKKHKYDKVVIENNMIVYKKVYKHLLKNNIPIYFHLHNDLGDKEKTISNALIISKTAEKVLCVSNFLANSFNECTKSNKTCVLYNCIDYSKFKNSFSKVELKKEFNFDDSIIFIYTGRIVKNKGVEELIEAFKRLNKKYKNIKLLLIGFASEGKENSYEKNIKKNIEDNKNIKPFCFMEQDKLNKYIVASDIVVIPTIVNEGFGLVAIEAMALKKTIIATNSGGLSELLDNNCSVIIERDNIVENLEHAMDSLYKNKKLRTKLAHNGYLKVMSEKDFDKNNYFDNFLNAIDEKSR